MLALPSASLASAFAKASADRPARLTPRLRKSRLVKSFLLKNDLKEKARKFLKNKTMTRLIFYRLIYINSSKMSTMKTSAKTILTKFGRQVRKTRIAKKLSQEDLAGLAGLHWTYISGVERGIRNISLKNIVKISKALEIKLKDLLDPIVNNQSQPLTSSSNN